jgi:hypothetical protein
VSSSPIKSALTGSKLLGATCSRLAVRAGVEFCHTQGLLHLSACNLHLKYFIMQTDMHTVKLIVQDVVRRERRIMVTMMMVVTGVALIMSQSQTVRPVALNQSPISSFTLPPSSSSSSYSSSSSSSSYLTSSVLRTRRILQQLDPALVERAVNELKMLVQVLEKDMGGTIAATIDAPQGEPAMESIQPLMGHSSLQVPAPAPAPAPEPTALASEACTCPPGPRGPPVSVL